MKINIRFLLYISKTNRKGVCPIRCRITYNKNRKEFSTGLFINPEYWDSKQQIAEPPNKENTLINQQLSLIENKIRQAFLLLQVKENNFTIDDIYTLYKGKKIAKEHNVLEVFESYLDMLKKLIGIDIKEATWNKFHYVRNNVKSFIKWKHKTNDFPLKKLTLQFLIDFEYYLKVEKSQKQITINKSIQRFRKPIKVALSKGYLDRDPFMLYKTKSVKTEIVFLSVNELKKLEKHQFYQPRLQQVKDWFVFSCYTGLAYNEIKNFKKQHIVKGFDDELWIEMKREKTQRNISVPLLPKARELIDKYEDDNSDNIFNICSNQRYNSYLKEVASILGITKRLTTHTARKTFASTVLLYNDVPMEIVSQLLGHSSITITEDSYGKVVQKKVSEQMKRLNNIK
ncbi:Site-specific recombinase XerD [Lutibacter agarilyticus]|uniref:Site-specific recombinase XerD n=1 Tax=Lutibacter agarilyticus TaxID=1109740 RepID=A0A238YBY5_9FLAO|nr:site-specific integrase [Lutibacter agarilyticus]SNR68482.1 Site-specific recombinase XerD [Lutibacter agarilyticus]